MKHAKQMLWKLADDVRRRTLDPRRPRASCFKVQAHTDSLDIQLEPGHSACKRDCLLHTSATYSRSGCQDCRNQTELTF